MAEYTEELSKFHKRVEQRKEQDKDRANFPIQYRNEKLRFTKINKNSKEPLGNNWNTDTYQYNDEELINSIVKQGINYGVVCGYGNLIVIDWDNRDFYDELKDKLPNTFQTQSPSYKSCPHSYYFIEDRDQPDGFRLRDDNGNTLADIQGKGTCVVGTKSIHPDYIDGEPYKVVNDIPISTIKWEQIIEVFEPYINEKTNITGKTREKKEYEPRDNELIDKIKAAIPIDVALQNYDIDTSHNPTGCPFHDSKKGKCLSFNTSDNTWHCFHCGEGGDIFNLVALYMGLDTTDKNDFKKLLKVLSDEAGIEYEISDNKTEPQDDVETIIERQLQKYKSITISWKDLREKPYPPTRFYLYPLLKERSVNLISGDSGSGKTLFVLSMMRALHSSSNLLHFERQIQDMPKVLFIDGEMGREQLQAYMLKQNYPDDAPFTILSKMDLFEDKDGDGINIADPINQRVLAKYIEYSEPDIIIFDNLFNLANINHNDAQEVMATNQFFAWLRRKHTINIIHHTNKTGKSYFGSVNHITIVDTSYLLNRIKNKDNNIMVEFKQMKYRPLLDNSNDRKMVGKQQWIYDENEQRWKHLQNNNFETNANSRMWDDPEIIRMLCSYENTDNGKLKKKYTQKVIASSIDKSVETIKRRIDELTEQGCIFSKSNVEKYMTEKGYINYFRDEEQNTYEIQETLISNNRLYYFIEKDIDTLGNVMVDYQE